MQRKSKAYQVGKSSNGLSSIAWKPVKLLKNSSQKESVFNDQTSTSSIRDTDEMTEHLEERMMTDLKISEAFSQKNDVLKSDLHFNKHVEEVFKCRCNVCWEGRRLRHNFPDQSSEAAFFKEYKFQIQDSGQQTEKDFVFILKRLAPHKAMSNSLRLFIPDTACFIQGECKFIAYTGKDRTIKFLKQKDKLGLPELRKYFDERRRKKDDDFVLEEPVKKQKEEAFLTTLPDTIGKSEIKSDLSGAVNSPLLLMKSSFMKKFTTTMKSHLNEGLVNKEVATIRFQDDSATMFTEFEFNNFLLKRKIDPIWKTVQYFQSTMRIKKGMHALTRIYFVYDREKNQPFFKRALQEVRFLAGEIIRASEDYIPPQEDQKFEEDLKANNEKDYCLYLLYKIYHFLNVVYGVHILKMGGDFVKDETGIIWLMNISRLHYESLDMDLKGDFPLRNQGGFSAFEKDVLAEELEEHYKEVERRETVKLLNSIISQHYENIKKCLNGVEIQEVYYDENITDEIFKKLHPNAPFGLSDVLHGKLNFETIRNFIVNDTRRILYPHRSRDTGKSLELIAKQTYAGCPPRVVPGMVVKRGDEDYSNSMMKTKPDQLPKQRDRNVAGHPVININNHGRLKVIIGHTFLNTALNLRPSTRETFIRQQSPFSNSRKISQDYRPTFVLPTHTNVSRSPRLSIKVANTPQAFLSPYSSKTSLNFKSPGPSKVRSVASLKGNYLFPQETPYQSVKSFSKTTEFFYKS